MLTKVSAPVLVIALLLLVSCDSVAGEIAYRPPGLPLRVSVNTWGQVSMSVEGNVRVPTFLGDFEAGVIVDPARRFSVENTLRVRLNGREYFYDLHGQDFSTDFESGYYEKVALIRRGSNLILELEKVNEPRVEPVPVQPPTAIPQPSPLFSPHQPSSSSRPSGVTIPVGRTFSPTAGWTWICTGDFSVIRSGGNEIALHDDLENTGLVLVLEQNSAVTVKAPYGGRCEPFSQEEKSSVTSGKVLYLMNSEGCGGTCSKVNVKELNMHGEVVRDYWRP